MLIQIYSNGGYGQKQRNKSWKRRVKTVLYEDFCYGEFSLDKGICNHPVMRCVCVVAKLCHYYMNY